LLDAFIEASDAVFGEVVARLKRGEAVCVETVLSTDKYCPVVNQVAAAGGYFALIYVALRSPQLAAERVANRVRAGGHDVPADKITARWHRSFEWLPWFAARASVFWVFDNSDATPELPPLLIARGVEGKIQVLKPDAIPEITHALGSLPRLPN
jgi:predicted ABC-type ATPase